jgi:hypothetical protein
MQAGGIVCTAQIRNRQVELFRIRSSDVELAQSRARAKLSQLVADAAGGRCDPVRHCPLTTAACEEAGLPDRCLELALVRRLRDNWLVWQPGGLEDVQAYYGLAPAILKGLAQSRRRPALLQLYVLRLLPACLLTALGAYRIAYLWLRRGVVALASQAGIDYPPTPL